MTRSDKYGSPLRHDPEFRGPQKHRSCTDICCLLLFAVFLAVWAGIALYAYKSGNPERLILPVDSYGHRCGQDELSKRPNLFFFDLTKCISPDTLWVGCQTPQVCLSECPDDVWVADMYLKTDIPFNKTDVQARLICTDQSIVQTVDSKERLRAVIDQSACVRWYVPSVSFYYRCFPNISTDFAKIANDYWEKYTINVPFNSSVINETIKGLHTLEKVNEVAQNVIQDLDYTWRYLALFSIAAVFVSLFYIMLLRYLAGLVIWASIVTLIALFSTGSYFSYKNYRYLKDNPFARIVQDSTNIEGKVNQVFNKSEFWLVLLVVCAVLLLLIILIVVFLRGRIRIATALIKEGSKAVSNTITTLFFPLVPWALQLLVLLWAAAVFAYLYSIGQDAHRIEGMDQSCTCTGVYKDIQNNASCTVQEFNKYCHQSDSPERFCYTAGCSIYSVNTTGPVLYLQLYNLFGLFWALWFISGLSQMILAGTFATWYWTLNKRNAPFFGLSRSVIVTLAFHMGTVAFGSLILAICSFIRAMIEFAERKLKKYDNALTKAIFCCCKCFFWCLEKFLCFVNRNAYIMCAIHGKNFCTSAKDAFELIMRNLIRVVFVDKVSDFLFFLGKVLVTAAMVVGSYFVFTGKVRLLDNSTLDVSLHYPWIPMAMVGFMTYIIATIFFSVYSVAVDTLFLCFLEDCERNDGTPDKPYRMSKELMKILGKKNKRT